MCQCLATCVTSKVPKAVAGGGDGQDPPLVRSGPAEGTREGGGGASEVRPAPWGQIRQWKEVSGTAATQSVPPSRLT